MMMGNPTRTAIALRAALLLAVTGCLLSPPEVRAGQEWGNGPSGGGRALSTMKLSGRGLQTDHRPLLNDRSVGILLSMGAAAWVSRQFEDADGMARTLDGTPFDGFIDFGDRYGDGLTAGMGTVGFLLAGYVGGSDQLSAFGRDMGQSLLLSWGAVWALKLSINARRPNGGSYSFPSGHTATAFAAAPVITKHWGWKAGLPAYAVATATALGRMEDRRHYLADVLFGAAIGMVAGYQIVGAEGLPRFLDYVAISPQRLGLALRF